MPRRCLPVSGWRLGRPRERGGRGGRRGLGGRASWRSRSLPRGGGAALTTPLSLSFPACKERVQGRQWPIPRTGGAVDGLGTRSLFLAWPGKGSSHIVPTAGRSPPSPGTAASGAALGEGASPGSPADPDPSTSDKHGSGLKKGWPPVSQNWGSHSSLRAAEVSPRHLLSGCPAAGLLLGTRAGPYQVSLGSPGLGVTLDTS